MNTVGSVNVNLDTASTSAVRTNIVQSDIHILADLRFVRYDRNSIRTQTTHFLFYVYARVRIRT